MRLTLPLPPSSNRLSRAIQRNGKTVVISSSAYRAWKADAQTWLQMVKTQPIKGDVRVALDIYYSDRRRDADSAIKPALDVMQGWCYENDRQVREIHAIAHTDKAKPRIEATVEAM